MPGPTVPGPRGQHFALLGGTLIGPKRLRDLWAEDLATGRRRGGIAFGGLLPGPPILAAVRSDDGWILDGHAPWVSGWGRIDLVHVSARGPDDTIVGVVIDAAAAPGLSVERQRLSVVDASATVHLSFDAVEVADERVLGVQPFDPETSLGASLRMNGSLALGVAGRCLRLIGPSMLDAELDDLRDLLDAASPDEMADRRAAASAFAYRAAGALLTHVGRRSVLRSEHAQRLAREAQFILVFGSRPMIRAGLLARLGSG